MNFSESDRGIIYTAQARVDAEYENLYDLFNFPPFGTKYDELFGLEDYISDLINARNKIIRNQMELLMGDYNLFSNFKKKYEKQIKEAKRYKKESNDNPKEAFAIFEKEKGLPKSYLGGRDYTPW